MTLQAGVTLVEDAEQHVAALTARRRAPPVLLVVHSTVHDAERVGDAGRLVRERDGAVGSRDLEAGSLLFERHRGSGGEGIDALRAHACQDAELVTADAVDLALARHGFAELLRDPGEERVAGGMAERVVVGLEPVEVEQHQDGGRPGVECGAEVDHQLAPVAHAREGIRLGFEARLARSTIFSRNVNAIRATTASMQVAARTTAGVFSGSNCP